MAAKRKPPPVRILQPRPLAGTGTAELAATVGDKFRLDSPNNASEFSEYPVPCYGIRECGTDKFDARPGMTKSQVYDEVARLNAGLPVTKESQGIGRRPRYATEAVRWVEILMNVPETRARLLAVKADGGKLSADDVRELITYHDDQGGPDFHKVFPLPTDPATERKLINAVWKQLERVLGIRRAMSPDQGSRLNAVRKSKQRDAARARSQTGIDPEHHEWMERGARKAKR